MNGLKEIVCIMIFGAIGLLAVIGFELSVITSILLAGICVFLGCVLNAYIS